MEDVVAHGISKAGLVTDECDPTEVDASKSRSEGIVAGPCGKREGECPPSTVYYETPEQFISQCWSGGPKSCNPFNFEIEPGHWDFIACTSVTYSKPFSSDPGSRKSSSTTNDSSSSSKGHFSRSSGIPGNLSALRDPSSTKCESTKNNPRKASLSKIGAHRQSRKEIQPRKIIIQPLLANYTWEEVEDMIKRAVMSKDLEENEEDLKGPPSNLLGRGGFGNVYMGILARNNDKPVAVKILGEESRQGDDEFLNEVNLLSSVNHRNLVKLVGYCLEGSHRVLVYEYADEGSIGDHIHGSGILLDWRTRLKVSLESAYGLEYLHTGCNPRIIHRDIKSSNILLTKSLVAKVADFGLSKMGLEDDSGNQAHFSTAVKGTPGYLDPAYSKTGQLDEKSDIYSFGVVLLEMITGRKPNDPSADPLFIGDWVKKQSGCLKVIVDSRLGGTYNPKAMKEVHTLALKCIDESPKNRPDIRKVVNQLRAAVETEDNTLQASRWSLRSLLGQT